MQGKRIKIIKYIDWEDVDEPFRAMKSIVPTALVIRPNFDALVLQVQKHKYLR